MLFFKLQIAWVAGRGMDGLVSPQFYLRLSRSHSCQTPLNLTWTLSQPCRGILIARCGYRSSEMFDEQRRGIDCFHLCKVLVVESWTLTYSVITSTSVLYCFFSSIPASGWISLTELESLQSLMGIMNTETLCFHIFGTFVPAIVAVVHGSFLLFSLSVL